MYIRLTQNKVTQVDDEDYKHLSRYKWCFANGYAVRANQRVNGKIQKKLSMHRVILNAPDGVPVDHINRNRLDNRKSNLRLCDSHVNNANASIRSDNTSGCRGVSWNKNNNAWVARIQIRGHRKLLGYFKTFEEAKVAYLNADTTERKVIYDN